MELRDKIARALAEWHGGPDAEPWVYDMYTEAADAVLDVLDLDKVRAEAQLEVLTDVAGSFFARTHDGMPNGRAYNSYSVARIVREVADRIAREAGIETADAPDCDTHNLVQHRDMKPPWCNKCGRDASGQMQRKEQS